jgi:sugar phosphate permease
MAERKDRMALLSRYSKLHTLRFEQKPSLNLNVEQWAADALIESYGMPACYDLLEYYFTVAQNPTWKYFANYAHDIIDKQAQHKTDEEERKQRREMARKWLSE